MKVTIQDTDKSRVVKINNEDSSNYHVKQIIFDVLKTTSDADLVELLIVALSINEETETIVSGTEDNRVIEMVNNSVSIL